MIAIFSDFNNLAVLCLDLFIWFRKIGLLAEIFPFHFLNSLNFVKNPFGKKFAVWICNLRVDFWKSAKKCATCASCLFKRPSKIRQHEFYIIILYKESPVLLKIPSGIFFSPSSSSNLKSSADFNFSISAWPRSS